MALYSTGDVCIFLSKIYRMSADAPRTETRTPGTPSIGSLAKTLAATPPVDKDRAWNCIDAMHPIALQHGVSVARVALAWLLHQPQVTSVIIGAKRPEQLADNIAATSMRLTPHDLERIDQASRLPAEYPGWMSELQGENRRNQIAASRRPGSST